LLFRTRTRCTTQCVIHALRYISEGACNLAGLGFKGNDKKGRPDWTLLRCVCVCVRVCVCVCVCLCQPYSHLASQLVMQAVDVRTSEVCDLQSNAIEDVHTLMALKHSSTHTAETSTRTTSRPLTTSSVCSTTGTSRHSGGSCTSATSDSPRRTTRTPQCFSLQCGTGHILVTL
jgi:hypothetical protein